MATAGPVRIVRRETQIFRRLWHASIFSGLVSPLLFLVAMGVGLGGLVEERSGSVEGMSYLHYVTPGLLAASAMMSAAGASLWPVMGGLKWSRQFHGMVATPLRPSDVYLGYVLWVGLRTLLFSTVFVAVAAVMGGVISPWGVLAPPAAALGGLAIAAPLAAFTATQETDSAFPVVFRVGVMPLFLFSGTFFPVSQLPSALRGLAVLSPLWHAVEIARPAAAGDIAWGPMAGHVAVLVGCFVAGWAWGARTFTRRLAP